MDTIDSDDSSINSEHFVDAVSMVEFNVLYNYNEETNSHSAKIAERENTTESQNPVDFVLVYGGISKNVEHCLIEEENKEKIRATFEKCLIDQGLQIEKESVGFLTFVKIHAPRHVLAKTCETLKLKMPMKEIEEDKLDNRSEFDLVSEVKTFCKRTINTFISIEPRKKYQERKALYSEYSRDKFYLFDESDPDFFDYSVRVLVIDFILSRVKWGKDANDPCRIGIEPLIEEDVYKSAYPLHDGGYRQEGSLRNQLRVEWADTRSWFKLQPIDEIKDYLGVKYAFYFAWLGFYTHLLIPASIFGLIVFLYGYITLSGDNFSADVCSKADNITMCPLCDKFCDYWKLSDTCVHAKITHLFDNNFTVVFAFLMSVWATFFLELWKRHAAVLSHRWGLTDYTTHAEHPRPQYTAKLEGSKKKKINPATGEQEVVLSFWFSKLPTVVFSYTVILIFILVVIGAVFSIVLYRMWMNQADKLIDYSPWIKPYSYLVVPSTAATLNLISIMLLNMIYNKVAIYLTNLELPRTQTEFENSLSIKMYIFQFVNYYSSLIYVAFLKGKFIGSPWKYNRIFGFRQEECSPGGCLIELSIQLAIIMVGQQILNSILEIVTPIIWKAFNKHTLKKHCDQTENEELIIVNAKKQWTEDYKLLEWGSEGLFWEYLEVVIQFGFVTLFASAFPLAPLFALLNNLFELRLDAKKILKYYRRPIPHRVPNIGVWYRVLDVIGKIAVVSNAAIIALSSNFIPKLVFWFLHKSEYSGFLEFSLSNFSTEDFSNVTAPLNASANVPVCRYYGYREPYKKYKRTVAYWQILVAKLLFIIIFQNVVFITKTAAQWLIPDVPHKLSDRINQENRLITELMVKRQTDLAIKNAGYNCDESSSAKKFIDEEKVK